MCVIGAFLANIYLRPQSTTFHGLCHLDGGVHNLHGSPSRFFHGLSSLERKGISVSIFMLLFRCLVMNLVFQSSLLSSQFRGTAASLQVVLQWVIIRRG